MKTKIIILLGLFCSYSLYGAMADSAPKVFPVWDCGRVVFDEGAVLDLHDKEPLTGRSYGALLTDALRNKSFFFLAEIVACDATKDDLERGSGIFRGFFDFSVFAQKHAVRDEYIDLYFRNIIGKAVEIRAFKIHIFVPGKKVSNSCFVPLDFVCPSCEIPKTKCTQELLVPYFKEIKDSNGFLKLCILLRHSTLTHVAKAIIPLLDHYYTNSMACTSSARKQAEMTLAYALVCSRLKQKTRAYTVAKKVTVEALPDDLKRVLLIGILILTDDVTEEKQCKMLLGLPTPKDRPTISLWGYTKSTPAF